MFTLDWRITISNYKLGILESVKIVKSVDSLADTATIKLPGKANQQLLDLTSKIKVGDQVLIELGYDGKLEKEFKGYVASIKSEVTGITIECEDEFYQLKKGFKTTKVIGEKTLEYIVSYMLKELSINPAMKLDCTAVFKYDDYVLERKTVYDELKKIKEETRTRIFVKDNALYIHPMYQVQDTSGKLIRYDFSVNIEKASLDYKEAADKKFYIEVKGNKKKVSNPKTDGDGKAAKPDDTVITMHAGDPAGEKKAFALPGIQDEDSVQRVANAELRRIAYTGYSGNFTSWLIPFVQPGDMVEINDPEFEYRKGSYYVSGVTTDFSSAGGVRTISVIMTDYLMPSMPTLIQTVDKTVNTSKIKLPSTGSISIGGK
jgi:hypothetical protein